MTAANADTWLPIAPGQEGMLALSIAYVLIHEGLANEAAAHAMTGGQGEAALAAYSPGAIAGQLGATPGVIDEAKITDLARSLASRGPALVLVGGASIAQPNGLFNARAGLILNGLLGNVGIRCRHRRHRVPYVKHLFSSQHIPAGRLPQYVLL